jgi:hypothetical protein
MHIIKHFKLLVNASDHLLQLLLIQLLQLSTALRIRRHEIDFLLLLMEAQLTLLDTICKYYTGKSCPIFMPLASLVKSANFIF